MREPLMETLRGWVGREFRQGESEQCANFVRAVFTEAGLPLGVTGRPSDWELTSDLEQGGEFANSFFGDDVGRVVTLPEALPGDLLAFRDTYEGDFPAGCITHVGIYAGGGAMIDRSTSSLPVRHLEMSSWWLDRLVEIRRPAALEPGLQ